MHVSGCRTQKFYTFIWCSCFTCLLSDDLLCWMNHWSVLVGQFVYSQVFSGKRWLGVLNGIVINAQWGMHVHLHSGMYLSYPGLLFVGLLLLFFPSRGIGLDRCVFIASVEAEMKFMSFAAGSAEVCLLLTFGFQSSDHENSLASWLS